MNIDINLSVDFLLILFVLIVFEITSHYVDLGALGFELYYVEKWPLTYRSFLLSPSPEINGMPPHLTEILIHSFILYFFFIS